MLTILQQILTCNLVISIMIEFPKSTVEDIEVLVRKVSSHFIDVFFLIDKLKGI